jgi:glycosyltransferase involved in cell wall biosynthesis
MTDTATNNFLISVIMPAYNAEKYIRESIESVMNQTCAQWELIIVDDGSSDNTGLVVKKIAENDNRIKYFYQQNSRQGKARNLAIQNSSGKYLAFLDADDLWHPEKLFKQVNCIQEKSVDLVFSDCYVFQNDINESSDKMNTFKGILKGEEGLKLFFDVNQVPILTVLVNRESVNRVGNFIEDFSVQNAEDYHLWMKMLLNGSVFYGMDEALSFYRIHENQNTKQDSRVPLQSISAIRSLNIKDNNSKKLSRQYLLKWYRYLLLNFEIKDQFQYRTILNWYLQDTARYFQFMLLVSLLKISGLDSSVSLFKKYLS